MIFSWTCLLPQNTPGERRYHRGHVMTNQYRVQQQQGYGRSGVGLDLTDSVHIQTAPKQILNQRLEGATDVRHGSVLRYGSEPTTFNSLCNTKPPGGFSVVVQTVIFTLNKITSYLIWCLELSFKTKTQDFFFKEDWFLIIIISQRSVPSSHLSLSTQPRSVVIYNHRNKQAQHLSWSASQLKAVV